MTLLFAILLLYFVFVEPILDRMDRMQFGKNLALKNQSARVRFYLGGFCRTWLMCGYLIAVVIAYNIPIENLGFHAVLINESIQNNLFIMLLVLLIFCAYFFYFYLCPLILHKFNFFVERHVRESLRTIAPLIPTNKFENFLWIINSLNAFTEELLYRGFVFFFIPYLWPNIHILFVIVISIFLDMIRYYPGYKSMQHVAITGFIYALSFFVFNSIYVPIVLHVIQDLSGLIMPYYLLKKNNEMYESH